MKRLGALGICLSLGACMAGEAGREEGGESLGSIENTIVGGGDAAAGRWPFIVEVRKAGAATGTANHWCGGVLVHPKWVLSARHCFTVDASTGGTLVPVSERLLVPARHRLDDGSATFTPVSLKQTPEKGVNGEDLILAELPQRVNQPTVRLMTEGDMGNTWIGEQSRLLGWGSTNGSVQATPNILQEGATTFLGSGSQCQMGMFGHLLCNGTSNSPPTQCSGDSGGPALIRRDARWMHQGVISFQGCPLASGGPGVQTRTASFNKWLAANLPQSEGEAHLWSVPPPGSGLGVRHQAFTGWGSHWDKIVAGDFTADGFDDLLFYRAATKTMLLYSSDSAGGLTLRSTSTNMASDWTTIVAGDFLTQSGEETIFYNAKTGAAKIFAFSQVHGWAGVEHSITPVNAGWDQIVPGNFNGAGRDDLFFYSAQTGRGAFYSNNNGTLSLMNESLGFNTNWDRIVPARVNGDSLTDLFFYDGTAGVANFATVSSNGTMTTLPTITGMSTDWTEIVPIENGSGLTGLFFYNQAAGTVVFSAPNGNGTLGAQTTASGFARSWSDVVPMLHGGFQNLLFYGQWGVF